MSDQKKINELMGKARHLRQQIEERLQAGESRESEEIQAVYTEAEKYIEDAEKLSEADKRHGSFESRMNALQADASEAPPMTVVPRGDGRDQHVASPEYRSAFEKYLRHGERLLTPDEHRVMQVAIDEMGGYTVPPDVQAELLRRLPTSTAFLDPAVVRYVPTSRDVIEWTRILPHPTQPDIYSSAFIGSWVSETPAAAAGEAPEPGLGKMIIGIKKARVKGYLSRDLAADSAFDVLGFLAEDGGFNLGLVAEQGILFGNAADQPRGLYMESDIPTVDVSGTTADYISNTSADLGSATKLLDLFFDLPAQYRAGARVAMHRTVQKAIRKLVDGNNNFIWRPGFEGSPNEIEGFPVMLSEFCPIEGTNLNKVLAFGNFRNYIVGMRQRIETQVLYEVKAEEELIVVILRTRLGGACVNPRAFRFGIV